MNWKETIERYLAEGRTVSGGDNPPDKPYVVLTLDDDDDLATRRLQVARNDGFEVLFVVEHNGHTRVILGNYSK